MNEHDVIAFLAWAVVGMGSGLIAILVWGAMTIIGAIKQQSLEAQKFRHNIRNRFGWHELRIVKIEDKVGIQREPYPYQVDE